MQASGLHGYLAYDSQSYDDNGKELQEEDDDDDDGGYQGDAPKTFDEHRRLQKAIFHSWLRSAQGQQALKTPPKRHGKDNGEDESISSIVARQHESSKIVKNPREYQIELFERAKEQNTIAVLDTGSGKTLIAVLLLRWVIDKELEARAASKEPHKISFFLVPSVNLAFQQFSVLECNLDYQIGRLCGADEVDSWKKPQWDALLASKHAIVCTPDILMHCLARSFITIKQINLIIFDEAHHAKRNHSYARIIKDFYISVKPADRPRIFGMTASPINAQGNVEDAAYELETLLHSRIATTSDMSISSVVKRPEESFHKYNVLPTASYETDLLQAALERYGSMDVFAKPLRQVSDIAKSLGSWCADSYLEYIFSADAQTKNEAFIEKRHYRQKEHETVQTLDSAIAAYREALEWFQQWLLHHPKSARTEDFSSKVLALKTCLQAHFERKSDSRCIVFVDRKVTAYSLNKVFSTVPGMGTEHLRCGFLVGSKGHTLDMNSLSFRQQILTPLKFRKGEINCLFATSVAEEGLDVPDCNLVVRFDPYRTMIQYVQSRGRARNQHSKFLHMLEAGNSKHEYLFRSAVNQEADMRKFCQSLAPDRFLTGNDDRPNPLLEPAEAASPFTIPSTGAKLTIGNALGFLATFVSAIPGGNGAAQHPTYTFRGRNLQFMAEVILPDKAPFTSMLGPWCSRKGLAKKAVAFQACVFLHTRAFLDDHLQPTYAKRIPAMQNALLAVDGRKKSTYANRVKPDIWAQDRNSFPSDLWMTVIDFPQALDRPHRPMILLTRTCMPRFPNFPVFLNDARETTVVSTSIEAPLRVTKETVVQLAAFTFRILRDVFSKTYEQDAAKLSYWLCPGTISAYNSTADPSTLVDWALLDEVSLRQEDKWYPDMPSEDLENKFLVDVWDGSRKFYSSSVNKCLRPTDPLPTDVAKTKFSDTILDYSVSLWKKARQRYQWTPNQPVVEAEILLTRRNLLAPPQTKETKQKQRAVLCPEPLRISVLPVDVVVAAVVFPAVIHRYESYLISLEGCSRVGVDCELALALAAFTKDSDNSGEEWTEERVNFQHGMGENYERLEFIGDTFLKMATTMSTFINYPDENQFGSHVARMVMLCNKNLFDTATGLSLYEYIRCKSFSRRLWYPEGIRLLEGKGAKKEGEGDSFHKIQEQALGKKTIADVREALIAAALLSHNKLDGWQPNQWEQAIRAVTKLVNSGDHKMLAWDDYRTAYVKPAYQLLEATATQQYLAAEVECKHSYKFKHPRLLYSAFLHPSMSFMTELIPNYERLKSLRDALLDLVSMTFLFYRHPNADPQWLTVHKEPMVGNKFFGALCVLLGFYRHLRHTNAGLDKQIRSYVIELSEARDAAKPGCPDFWTTVSDPPKCLSDMVEAYVAAVFIDSDFNYAEVQRFFDTHIRHFFTDMSIYDTFAQNHPFTRLHTRLQAELGCEQYMMAAEEIAVTGDLLAKEVAVGVMVHNHVVTHSKGKSDRYTRVRAAYKALEELDGLPPSAFRAKYGCDCTAQGSKYEDITPNGPEGR